MEIVKFIYNEKEVDFLPSGKDNVMVNATQMAKIFGKRVDVFLKTDHAKEFINVLLSTPYGVNKTKFSKEEIVQTNKKGGTWMHRIFALKFAAWLDPRFELWVFETIDNIINHHFREQRDALVKKISLKQKKEDKKKELLLKYPKLAEYFDLETEEKQAGKNRIKAIRKQVKQLQMDFLQEKEE